MRLSIHIHHTFSIDESTKEFIKSLLPSSKEIEDLTAQVKEKTEQLSAVVNETGSQNPAPGQ